MMVFGGPEILSALWLGILTSISPCPLATNVAATSYIGRQIHSRFATVWAAVAYTAGRILCYVAVSFAIVAGLVSIPMIANFLQVHMNRILGPVLSISGVFVLGLIPLKMPTLSLHSEKLQKLGESGFYGAVLLGFLFALSFCPVSAALFFGSVIPLALKSESCVFLPLTYGVGTALPVMGVAFIMAYSSRLAGIIFNRLTQVEIWLRRITGILFVLIGSYLSLKYLFHIIDF